MLNMKIAAPGFAFFVCFSCLAQPSAPAPPAFDVASVRLVEAPGNLPRALQTAPGSLTIRNYTLRNCIRWAYGMRPYQMTAPNWLNDIVLDITAKAAGPADDSQLQAMLRTLLAERLGVKAHIEPKEMQIYAVALAKGGPRFHESTTEGPVVFGNEYRVGLTAERASVSDLAKVIAEILDRPVIDATGLKGRYDIRIDLTPYLTVAASAPQEDLMSILSTGLEERLGVKLEGRRGNVDTLVVDHAEKTPTQN